MQTEYFSYSKVSVEKKYDFFNYKKIEHYNVSYLKGFDYIQMLIIFFHNFYIDIYTFKLIE